MLTTMTLDVRSPPTTSGTDMGAEVPADIPTEAADAMPDGKTETLIAEAEVPVAYEVKLVMDGEDPEEASRLVVEEFVGGTREAGLKSA